MFLKGVEGIIEGTGEQKEEMEGGRKRAGGRGEEDGGGLGHRVPALNNAFCDAENSFL